jgi:hypothetical protein
MCVLIFKLGQSRDAITKLLVSVLSENAFLTANTDYVAKMLKGLYSSIKYLEKEATAPILQQLVTKTLPELFARDHSFCKALEWGFKVCYRSSKRQQECPQFDLMAQAVARFPDNVTLKALHIKSMSMKLKDLK